MGPTTAATIAPAAIATEIAAALAAQAAELEADGYRIAPVILDAALG
jgi:hypothetical protein